MNIEWVYKPETPHTFENWAVHIDGNSNASGGVVVNSGRHTVWITTTKHQIGWHDVAAVASWDEGKAVLNAMLLLGMHRE